MINKLLTITDKLMLNAKKNDSIAHVFDRNIDNYKNTVDVKKVS